MVTEKLIMTGFLLFFNTKPGFGQIADKLPLKIQSILTEVIYHPKNQYRFTENDLISANWNEFREPDDYPGMLYSFLFRTDNCEKLKLDLEVGGHKRNFYQKC